MLSRAELSKPTTPIRVMLAANARRERVGLGPKYAQMRTLLPSGKYAHHWVVAHREHDVLERSHWLKGEQAFARLRSQP